MRPSPPSATVHRPGHRSGRRPRSRRNPETPEAGPGAYNCWIRPRHSPLKEAGEVASDERGAVERQHSDVLEAWENARAAAAESQYVSPRNVYRALQAIAEIGRDYFAARDGGRPLGPIEQAFRSRVPFKYTSFESQTTLALYGEARVFRRGGDSRQMQKHLTLGGGQTSNCLQIYFEFDDTHRRVIIGYCGRHLPYSGSRT